MSASTARSYSPQSSDDPVFDDIRPCRDDEVESELAKICADDELINGILRLKYPVLSKCIAPFLRPLVRGYLKKRAAKIRTVADFQNKVADVMRKMIASTTDGAVFEGFDKLEPGTGYLFISNHRDISLDPAFVDLALHDAGFDTVRIAIGDNLLRLPVATALMRLNKSFIVKRSITSPREKLKALTHLSTYIGLSIKDGHSIWIAQREGRAKDGNDRTEEAVLKMFHVYGRSLKESFKDYMVKLNIVPVAITYEYDPSDLAKARELYTKRTEGCYHKSQFEDIDSIVGGIKGYKGRVKICAGSPIKDGFETPAELAAIIDDFIWSHYVMYPTTLIAAGAAEQVDDAARQKFEQRIKAYPEELREQVLSMYAMPYRNLQQLQEQKAGRV